MTRQRRCASGLIFIAAHHRKPELPADLTEADWSVMLRLLELVRATIPSNDQSPPWEIGIMKEALLEHFRQKDEQPKKSLPPRGKKVRSKNRPWSFS